MSHSIGLVRWRYSSGWAVARSAGQVNWQANLGRTRSHKELLNRFDRGADIPARASDRRCTGEIGAPPGHPRGGATHQGGGTTPPTPTNTNPWRVHPRGGGGGTNNGGGHMGHHQGPTPGNTRGGRGAATGGGGGDPTPRGGARGGGEGGPPRGGVGTPRPPHTTGGGHPPPPGGGGAPRPTPGGGGAPPPHHQGPPHTNQYWLEIAGRMSSDRS